MFDPEVCVCVCSGSDNLARCGALESLVESGILDDTWDDKALNRMSTIRFMEDDDDDEDDDVRKKLALINHTFKISSLFTDS